METTKEAEPPLNQSKDAQLSLIQPSGTEPSTVQNAGTEPLTVQITGTEPSITETSGGEHSDIQPSGIQPSGIQPSGIRTESSSLSGEQPIRATSPVKAPAAPMPSFTSQGPGSTRIKSPIRGETLISPTNTTPVRERVKAREASIAEMVRQQRDGTWDGIPRGFSIVNERLVQNIKSKDVQKPEEVTALLTLGSPKTSTNKLSNEDEGLGEALHDLLNNSEGTPAANRGSASPLPSITGVDPKYFSDNAVDYGTDNSTDGEDLLRAFEDDDQPSGIQSQDAQQDNQPIGTQSQDNQPIGTQSQDAQQNNQPSGIREARTQAVQPVLTQQGVID